MKSTWKNRCVKHFFSYSYAHYCELVSDVMESALPATASRTLHRSGGRALSADGEPMRRKNAQREWLHRVDGTRSARGRNLMHPLTCNDPHPSAEDPRPWMGKRAPSMMSPSNLLTSRAQHNGSSNKTNVHMSPWQSGARFLNDETCEAAAPLGTRMSCFYKSLCGWSTDIAVSCTLWQMSLQLISVRRSPSDW